VFERLLQLLASLATPWKEIGGRQRLALLFWSVAVFGAIWGFRAWMVERSYHPLYSDLSAEEAGAAVARLQQLQVPYRLGAGGTMILVPEPQLAEARLQLAQAGLPRQGRLGFEIFDEVRFGATEFAEQVSFRRALEGELERSILTLHEVSRARVHVSLPKRSVFLQREEPAKASVVLQMRGASQLSEEQVQAIAHLVASAVEGLDASRVVIVDSAGHVLAKPGVAGDEVTSEQLAYQRSVEREIVRKILATLEPYLGFDRARASVAAECGWDAGEKTEELVDPNTVVTSTQRSEEVVGATAAAGIPGTASNLPRQPASPQVGPRSQSRVLETTNYQASRTVTRTTLERGAIKRLSIALLVDHKIKLDEQAGKLVRQPRTAEEMTVIRDLVTAAAGLVQERGDTLTIESLPFTIFEPPPAPPEPPTPEVDYFSLDWIKSYRYYLIGAALLIVAAFLGAVAFARLKYRIKKIKVEHETALAAEEAKREIEAAEQEAKRRELEEARMLKGLKMAAVQSSKAQVLRKHVEETAEKDTEGFVQLLRTWIHEDDK
jgi:flagellar M-ring protein FliF